MPLSGNVPAFVPGLVTLKSGQAMKKTGSAGFFMERERRLLRERHLAC